ncbi:hypothetical protein AGMMS50268_11020 [Spirochaetia bacterium]|nr:hypothetical protein AGMMS50268_11020 [Spirochaetia bacterium]
MGILERRGREKAERKSLIMQCTKELILEYGVEKVSMENIAQKAELSKATLYLYFPSKDVLFNEICEEAARKFSEEVKSRTETGISGLDALKRFWVSYLEIYGESEDMIIFFKMRHFVAPASSFIPAGEDPESSSCSSQVFYFLLKKMIEQGMDEGTFEAGTDAGLVARTIISLFSYTVENAANMPRGARKPALIIGELRDIFQVILRGIAREGIDRSCLILSELGFENGRN